MKIEELRTLLAAATATHPAPWGASQKMGWPEVRDAIGLLILDATEEADYAEADYAIAAAIVALVNVAPAMLEVIDAAQALSKVLAEGGDWKGYDDDLEAALAKLDAQ